MIIEMPNLSGSASITESVAVAVALLNVTEGTSHPRSEGAVDRGVEMSKSADGHFARKSASEGKAADRQGPGGLVTSWARAGPLNPGLRQCVGLNLRLLFIIKIERVTEAFADV